VWRNPYHYRVKVEKQGHHYWAVFQCRVLVFGPGPARLRTAAVGPPASRVDPTDFDLNSSPCAQPANRTVATSLWNDTTTCTIGPWQSFDHTSPPDRPRGFCLPLTVVDGTSFLRVVPENGFELDFALIAANGVSAPALTTCGQLSIPQIPSTHERQYDA